MARAVGAICADAARDVCTVLPIESRSSRTLVLTVALTG
jgi:hypothetical protein